MEKIKPAEELEDQDPNLVPTSSTSSKSDVGDVRGTGRRMPLFTGMENPPYSNEDSTLEDIRRQDLIDKKRERHAKTTITTKKSSKKHPKLASKGTPHKSGRQDPKQPSLKSFFTPIKTKGKI